MKKLKAWNTLFSSPVNHARSLLFILLLTLFALPALSQGLSDASPVDIFFFYSPDCRKCLFINNEFLPPLQKQYPSLRINSFNINNLEDYKIMVEFEKKYGEIRNPPPTIIINNHILDGKGEIVKELEPLIQQILAKGSIPQSRTTTTQMRRESSSNNIIVDKFKSLSLLVIIGAGLLDGINPCAFATILFLISYLFFIQYSKRQILIAGASFTIGVFTAYIGIGIGFFEFFTRITIFPLLSRIFAWCIAGIALVIGFFSLYDFMKIKQGKLSDISLQLPKLLKIKIHDVIRRKFILKHYIITTYIAGFSVALLEFPCTGQVYIPIIFAVRKFTLLRTEAFLYLLLYNLMFIFPLVIVFLCVYYGVSSQRLIKVLQKHAGLVKISTAFLFFALAAIIIYSL